MQRLKGLRYDCDEDALLALVEPAGPACHTGERTCFYRGDMEPAVHEALPALERVIAERRGAATEDSYTARLLADPPHVGREGARGGRGGRARRRARSRTSGWPRRPPTCSTTCPCCWPPATCPWPTRCGCSMSVVAELELSPTLEEARELATQGDLVPLRHTFIADCETPVSAYLKLRGDGPSFLLESAEQGQRFGRWSFLGFRPRAVIRWERGDEGDPYEMVEEELGRLTLAPVEGLPPLAGGAVGLFGYDLVRTFEPSVGEPNPDELGSARARGDDRRAAGGLRPPAPRGDGDRQRARRTSWRRATRAPRRRSPRCASAWPARSRG